jgi:hypothetical protein
MLQSSRTSAGLSKTTPSFSRYGSFFHGFPSIEVDTSLGGLRVRRVLDRGGGGEGSAGSHRSG